MQKYSIMLHCSPALFACPTNSPKSTILLHVLRSMDKALSTGYSDP